VLDLTFPATGRHGDVSALLHRPADAAALVVLGHGAGAGMRHPFLEEVAVRFGARGLATLRFQFPYMEQGRRRPDPASVCAEATRAAVRTAAEQAPDLPLFAGGKSFGGRMASGAQADEALPGVRGLLFLGFPLHPAGRPGTARARHLESIAVPMLFLQGTRDRLATSDLLRDVLERLPGATLHEVEGADHGFSVLKRSGRTGDAVLDELADTTASWIAGLA